MLICFARGSHTTLTKYAVRTQFVYGAQSGQGVLTTVLT